MIDAKFVNGPLRGQVRPIWLGPSPRWFINIRHEYHNMENIYRYGYVVHRVHEYTRTKVLVRESDGTPLGVEFHHVGVVR